MNDIRKNLISLLLFLLLLLSACKEEPLYTVIVSGGSGGGEYSEGTEVTVEATVPEGKLFVCWKEGGSVVSYEQRYTFTVKRDIKLVGEFADDLYLDLPENEKNDLINDLNLEISSGEYAPELELQSEVVSENSEWALKVSYPPLPVNLPHQGQVWGWIDFDISSFYHRPDGMNLLGKSLQFDIKIVNSWPWMSLFLVGAGGKLSAEKGYDIGHYKSYAFFERLDNGFIRVTFDIPYSYGIVPERMSEEEIEKLAPPALLQCFKIRFVTTNRNPSVPSIDLDEPSVIYIDNLKIIDTPPIWPD